MTTSCQALALQTAVAYDCSILPGTGFADKEAPRTCTRVTPVSGVTAVNNTNNYQGVIVQDNRSFLELVSCLLHTGRNDKPTAF